MVQRKVLHPAQFITLGLTLVATFIYFPPYARAFVGDDYVQLDYILEYVSRPLTAVRLLNPYTLPWYYRPGQNFWFLAHRLAFGYEPFGYYWLQLLVHALVIVMVYRVARQVGLRPYSALFSAALFAIHSHHQDVVGWISSIAIVLAALFTLLTVSVYLAYRKRPSRPSFLLLTFICFLLTLITHEESFLLPAVLLFWRLGVGGWTWAGHPAQRTAQDSWRGMIRNWPETAVFLLMFLSLGAYLYSQFTRPNLTISLEATPVTHWYDYLAPLKFALFLAQTSGKYIPIWGAQTFARDNFLVVAFLSLVGLALWYWYGNRVTRWGLAWATMHLAFIYWALWSQKPELYAGRHLYNAWIGLTLALGSSVDSLGRRELLASSGQGAHSWRLRASALKLYAPWLILLAYLMGSMGITRHHQGTWLADTQEETAVRGQLQALLPTVTDRTHLFATRFPITPRFLRSVVQVWYGRDQPFHAPFGPLTALRAAPIITPDYYLLDYEADGTLYNLAPEFQTSDRSQLLWRETPTVFTFRNADTTQQEEEAAPYELPLVIGAEGDRRLAIEVIPPTTGEDWLALAYTVTPPAGNSLRLGVHRAAGVDGRAQGEMRFRVRLVAGTEEEVAYEVALGAADGGWETAVIPLDAYTGQSLTIRLELAGTATGDDTGYWVNPMIGAWR